MTETCKGCYYLATTCPGYSWCEFFDEGQRPDDPPIGGACKVEADSYEGEVLRSFDR